MPSHSVHFTASAATSVHLTASNVYSANVAASIVASTTSLGLAYRNCFDVRRPLPLYGGGFARKKVLTRDELCGFTGPNGDSPVLRDPEYTLMDYIPSRLFDPHCDRHRDAVLVKVPFQKIIPMVGVDELRDLCKLHGIHATKQHVRATLVSSLEGHACVKPDPEIDCGGCEVSYAVLRPVREPLGKAYQGLLDVESPGFVSVLKNIPLDDVRCFLPAGAPTPTAVGFKVKAVRRSGALDLEGGEMVLENIPLPILLKRLSIQGIRSLAHHHGVSIPCRWNRNRITEAVLAHKCEGCRSLYYVLEPLVPSLTNESGALPWFSNHDQELPLLWDASFNLPTGEYPPRPTTIRDMASAMRGYCADLSPEAVEEIGCCVCGQLTLRTETMSFDETAYDMSLLEEDNCTRVERLEDMSPVLQVQGPVREPTLKSICNECDGSMKAGKRPKFALANHLWLGEVPECLKNLTLAEMALVTRVRYNRCVVRVSKGHAKMVANVIAFEHPSKKIYDRLPMSRKDLGEVLSVVFNGAKPPSDDDLKRTPVLVRRGQVTTALEWLKKNHSDYADLSIDYAMLDAEYALEGVPVGVVHNEMREGEGNVLDSAKSVFDSEPEVGTAEGPCPYNVNGLTAERFGTMTPTERKLAAMRYLKNGGSSLAVGHESDPQSMYNNPHLYPQMFPWLFPYGFGALGSDEHRGKISRENHINWLLKYHDKRFQEDAGFLIVLFNHQLIRQSSQGSFLSMKRGNFVKIAHEIEKLDPGVLNSISERLAEGGRFIPQSPEEQRCARLCDQVEYVGNHVDGSLARKKYQRSEIWSLVNFMNTPAWFITFSPADSKHPLCIYLASHDVEFKPEIKSYSERIVMISRNPVACARFFDYLVKLFLKHICGWSEEEVTRGLFGTPSGFYGTVEQQGRMTLHLHFMLWLRGQLPLNEIRERIMSEDSQFIQDLTEYIESCLSGEFLTGSKDEIAARVPYVADNEDRGIHTILVNGSSVPDGYVDPTLTLPEAPPTEFCEDPGDCHCQECMAMMSWWERTKLTIDDILFRSNVHTCYGRRDNKAGGPQKRKNDDGKFVPKMHSTGKGCINKDGVCTARFPRPIFWLTQVDTKTGHIDPRKREAQLNDVNVVITGCTRCNSDLRCLLSGTSVKAIVGYVTDYITKGWLKTHQVFSTMYETFKRNETLFEEREDQKAGNGARKMIMRIVNSLSSKMEIGAPMAAMYLLRNPDHYTSHEFVPFYWKNYTNYVKNQWTVLLSTADPLDEEEGSSPEDVGVVRLAAGAHDPALEDIRNGVVEELGVDIQDSGAGKHPGDLDTDGIETVIVGLEGDEALPEVHGQGDSGDGKAGSPCDSQATLVDDQCLGGQGHEAAVVGGEHKWGSFSDRSHEETIRMTRTKGSYRAKSNTDDYRFRPEQMSHICLYDFIQCSIRHPFKSSRAPRKDLQFYRYSDEHPQADTHAVALDPGRRCQVVPNFLGPALPRKDSGDREDYCCAMLTLFCPWRTGVDLKSADSSWEEVFDAYHFTDRQRDLMNNFNMRYECYDARDDFTALLKTAGVGEEEEVDDTEERVHADNGENCEDDDEELFGEVGHAARKREAETGRLLWALKLAGWKAANGVKSALSSLRLPAIAIDHSLRSVAWNNIVRVEKLRAWRRKQGVLAKATDVDPEPEVASNRKIRNDAFVVSSAYLSKDFQPANADWAKLITDTARARKLNPGQEKAFRIVANHGCCVAPDQLLMHLGGMGGTGKSTVIKALCDFFTARDESFRFVLMGPTGTSAALIGGSTYHTFLGLHTGRTRRGDTISKVEEVRERLTGVGYLLIDELSMLDCRALCAISARCCEALGVFEKPFGGLNVILCGDFAQLPPVQGNSLYSRKVVLRQSARQSISEQENTIGKLIWLQFTTVVILTENMRQTSKHPEEVAFRRALNNLRWRNCTDEDIRLIRSRIAGSQEGLSVESENFRDVSIITARNVDKDQINEANSAKFAAEHGQVLKDFYSIDVQGNSDPKRTDPKKRGRSYCTSKSITKAVQTALWCQPPCTSEQIPGRLRLCRGMPVIIRYNEATELCMTRGQEARVVGWSAVPVPKYRGKLCLDVLFVELVNPPHSVKLPNLPKNVVPLTRNSQSVEAQLPNDDYVCLSRSQVSVLPNFAMTDYSSQGKTREWNVIDLAECRSFQAAYTCLSRGTSIAQTLIMREFSDDLLRGKLDGALRQEYRELEHLSIITDLRYNGVLPNGIVQETRWETIDTYKLWKKTAGAAMQEAPSLYEDALLLNDKDYNVPKKPVDREHNTISSQLKRKAAQESKVVPVKKRKTGMNLPLLANTAWASPVGPLWDSDDWSCAFDAWTAVVYWVWADDRVKWSRLLKRRSESMCDLIEGFEGMRNEDPEEEITTVRNEWRSKIRKAYPEDFVEGGTGTDIMGLTEHLMGYNQRTDYGVKCSGCGRSGVQPRGGELGRLGAFTALQGAASVQQYVDRLFNKVSECAGCGGEVFLTHDFSHVVAMDVRRAPDVALDPWITVGDWGLYRLAGVVYYGEFHFISRVVGRNNKVYVHDGMEGGTGVYEGVLGSTVKEGSLGTCRDKGMSLAVYVIADRVGGEAGGLGIGEAGST